MLALVALELVPEAFGRRNIARASAGTLAGAGAMLALAVAVGV
jgi:hypothetical protein